MNSLLPLRDVLWTPRPRCLNLGGRRPTESDELQAHRIDALIDIQHVMDWPCYVAELDNGKIIGNAKLVATADDTVLGDIQFLYGAARPDDHWVLSQRRLRLPQLLAGKAALLAASNAENYYHWLFDSLPRLALLEAAGYDLDAIEYFLLDDSKRAFQIESLARFGIGQSRLQHCSKRRVLRCERLIVPSMPALVGYPPRWLCEYLRCRFTNDKKAPPSRKIYISRRHARGRKLLNELEILPLLVRRGYDIVDAERLAFSEQVDLFSSAREVISVHGAGLSNIVFAPRGARVLELASPLHNNLSFHTIAANSDLFHEHLVLNVAAGADRRDTRFTDLVVNPAVFERKLEAFSQQA